MRTFKGYIARIDADLDDGIIVGSIINTRDIIGFHGEPVSEATESFHAVIDEYFKESRQILKCGYALFFISFQTVASTNRSHPSP
jgi:predicted HicB family RNase H-like nuclease